MKNLVDKIKKKDKVSLAKGITLIESEKKSDLKYKIELLNYLKPVNNTIRIGVTGPPGIGKSTFINLLTGLVKPSAGNILIDGKHLENNIRLWLNSLGYVSQINHVFEGSLIENIALGINPKDVDKSKIEEVIELSCLKNFYKESKQLMLLKKCRKTI